MNDTDALKLEGKNINGTSYVLKNLIGIGGFGAVYLADEVVRNQWMRSLAIKVIDLDSSNQSQLTELQASVNFDNPHLIRCFACGEWENDLGKYLYLVMELADSSLDKKLFPDKTLSASEVQLLAKHIASALEYLHQPIHGKYNNEFIIHRDLKPANILWVKDKWKLSDFGIIRKSDRTNTFTDNLKGTEGYAPPEAYDGEISIAWDIWSLGIIMTQAFAGGLPYEYKNTMQLSKKVMLYELNLPTLPLSLDDLVKKCLQRETSDRPTATALLELLNPSSSPLLLDLGGGVKLELVNVPAGSYMMGSNEYGDEKPIHKVTLNGFKMSKYPITQSQYQAVMGTNPSHFKGENLPVEKVTLNNAVEFCEKLSKKIGQIVKLPSEAQWEYACRAGSTAKYCFGDDINQLGKYAWYGNNSGDKALDALSIWRTDQGNYYNRILGSNCKTHPVGEKLANAWGLHDMHGNVWEWCEDIWHDSYSGAPNDGSAWLKVGFFQSGDDKKRALRGGSWDYNVIHCRSAYRDRYNEANRNDSVGFRVVV